MWASFGFYISPSMVLTTLLRMVIQQTGPLIGGGPVKMKVEIIKFVIKVKLLLHENTNIFNLKQQLSYSVIIWGSYDQNS